MALTSSSSSTSELQYDVFLSFRGEDTRTNFTDHLYSALNRAGICTFRDGNDLERGEEIGPELRKAIEKSRYSIIVFSKNYASSTWCLDELAHIMKCRKTFGQIVLPVFYDVEPSDVRKQKRSYEEAFGGHEDRFKEQKEKLQRWRSALQEAADLKGVDVRNDADRHESTIIENIVKDISNKLHPRRLKVTINPVDIDSRANVVKSLLNHESVDVRIVGIYGLGGIGKTTIVKEVYNSIISKFEGSSFLANVRENSNPKGIVDLQNQLLSDILNGKHEKIYSSDRGLKLIEERLCNIRMIIVLDDVDKSEQINKILGNLHDWISQGSRIIITTRIKDLLPSRVYWQYQLIELNEHESLRLFSINAFGEWHPVEEYLECSKSFVDYCGGIPLALEVLGSYLSGQSIDVWESKLEKLKKTPHASIQDVLEISFHSLDKMERDIFLDIACFYIGNDKNYVISILDGCGFFAVDGINTLIKRCLLKIEFKNKLEMHDLIRDMGRQIISQESKEYGERSRVWHHEEAFELLQDETGTKAVEGLSLNLPRSAELFTEAFRKMNKLRLLQLNSVNLSGSYKHISKKLRWLCWSKFHLESIPTDLHLGNVVTLDMPYSSLKQVWEENKFLGKLKFLNLSHSHELAKTPNFEGLPNLERLILEDCPILVEVHKSIGFLTKLVTLNLKDCSNLENLPRSIGALRSLEDINMSGCAKLGKLPEELGNMKSLVVFAANRTAISGLPETFANLKNVTRLHLSNCKLKPFPIEGPNLSGFLPVSLRKLELRYCKLSDDMIPNYLQNLPLLEHLDLCGNIFSRLPPTINLLPKLSHLLLNECRRLKSVQELPSSLRELYAGNCRELERIILPNSDSLPGMMLYGCSDFVEIEDVFKVEPVGVEIVEKLLEHYGLSLAKSIANVRVCMRDNLLEKFWISPLQGLWEDGIYSLFLLSSEIPSLYSHQSCFCDSVTFNVPPLQGRRIQGLIISVVYARSAFFDTSPPLSRISIFNKNTMSSYYPTTIFLNEAHEDIMWLIYPRIENLEKGDVVKVDMDMSRRPFLVKKCGVNLLYPQNDQVASWASGRFPCVKMKRSRFIWTRRHVQFRPGPFTKTGRLRLDGGLDGGFGVSYPKPLFGSVGFGV